jgi:hypothetical protein
MWNQVRCRSEVKQEQFTALVPGYLILLVLVIVLAIVLVMGVILVKVPIPCIDILLRLLFVKQTIYINVTHIYF